MATLALCSKLFRHCSCFHRPKSFELGSQRDADHGNASISNALRDRNNAVLPFHPYSTPGFWKNSSFRISHSFGKACKGKKRFVPVSSSKVQLDSVSPKHVLDDLKSKVGNAIGIPQFDNNQPIILKGSYVAFGMEGKFDFVFASNGNYRLNYYVDYLSSINGFDGYNNWTIDASGNVQLYQLDDRDLHILIGWIRTSFWLSEHSSNFLDIFIPNQDDASPKLKSFFSEFENIIAIKILKSKVIAYMGLDEKFFPKRVAFSAYGNVEYLELDEWGKMSDSPPWQIPIKGVHKSFSGSNHSFQIRSNESCETYFQNFSDLFSLSKSSSETVDVSFQQLSENNFLSFFSMPNASKVYWNNFQGPIATFDSSKPNVLKIRRALSNHLLVTPLINGSNIGWFVLDSGASGSTIVPTVADRLNMKSFGNLFITGVNGSTNTSFRIGESFQLGPLHISSPYFIETGNLDSMIKGVGPVIGICGYEVFKNAVIELNLGSELTMKMFDPSTYQLPQLTKGVQWHKIYMMGNVPFVPARLEIEKNEPAVEIILILDIGAAGVDVIFHSRAVKNLGLPSKPSFGFSQMLGFGGNGFGENKHGAGVLAAMEVAGQRVEKVKAVFSMSSGGVDLSEYVSGLLTCDFFFDFSVVLDYSNLRMALIPSKR